MKALDPVSLRVLGALIEKEIATPENYPLSLNALLNACNQRSSREPVMELAEEQVRQALHGLEEAGMTAAVRDSRVTKYEHRIRTVLNLRRDETAVLCLLLLRGPQTPGELRSRADRLFSFDDLEAVQRTLERLAARGSGTTDEAVAGGQGAEPLVVVLPRQPGSREARWAHLLGGPVAVAQDSGAMRAGRDAVAEGSLEERLRALENELAELREAVRSMGARLTEREGKLLDSTVDAQMGDEPE